MWQTIAKTQGRGWHDNKTVKDLEVEADDEAAMTRGLTSRERIETKTAQQVKGKRNINKKGKRKKDVETKAKTKKKKKRESRKKALQKELLKTLELLDDQRESRKCRRSSDEEAEIRNKREDAIGRSGEKEETIWARNERRWGISMKNERNRKQAKGHNERKAWEARLAHGGAIKGEW